MQQLDSWLAGQGSDALRDRPLLIAEARLAWDGFWDLEGDRQLGAMGGIGPLPFVARSMWLEECGIQREERRWYHDLWRRMDSVYVGHYNRPKGDREDAGAGAGTADAGARRG